MTDFVQKTASTTIKKFMVAGASKRGTLDNLIFNLIMDLKANFFILKDGQHGLLLQLTREFLLLCQLLWIF